VTPDPFPLRALADLTCPYTSRTGPCRRGQRERRTHGCGHGACIEVASGCVACGSMRFHGVPCDGGA
jgi:hypothetical protein